jgi:hypothetical protein
MRSNNTAIPLRPEEDLLICCSRTDIDLGRAEHIKALLREDIDWSYLIQSALRHGLLPLLYRNLKATNQDSIPNGVLEELRKNFLINVSRNIYLTEELIKLLHLFEKDRIPAITYKGPIMAACVYGDITLRQFCDLDILIQDSDVPRVRELLVGQGYHPTLIFNNAAEEEAYFRSPYKRSLHFVREDRKVPLDLHWGIESKYLSFSSDLDVFKHLEQTFLNGYPIKTINIDYLIFLICLHGAQHAWAQLNWICDIAELIRLRKDIDWVQAVDHASGLGIHRMVSCGLLLASQLLGAELGEETLLRMKVDPFIQSTTDQIIRKLFPKTEDKPGRFEREIFYLRIMERLKDKARYCFNLVMVPTHAEWSTISLSKRLFSLYYILRPIRLVIKYGLKLSGAVFNKERKMLAKKRKYAMG